MSPNHKDLPIIKCKKFSCAGKNHKENWRDIGRELDNRRTSITTLQVVPLFCSSSFSREHRQTVGSFEGDELGNKSIIHLILFRDSKHWREQIISWRNRTLHFGSQTPVNSMFHTGTASTEQHQTTNTAGSVFLLPWAPSAEALSQPS